MRITEWEVNDALHVYFRHSNEYMLIFQDPDLHTYTDRHLIPLTPSVRGKNVNRRGAMTRRKTLISVDPQKFRPDAVLLDRAGRSHILEAKLGRINAVSECVSLVVQTLLYSDLILSPRWHHRDSPRQTYDLLEDIHEAFWFLKITDESFGKYVPVEKHHQAYFGLAQPLGKKSFEQTPSVIFLLEDADRERLKEACKAVQEATDFESFRTYAERHLRASSKFRHRLIWLKNEWKHLQHTNFAVMQLDATRFRAAIGGSISPL